MDVMINKSGNAGITNQGFLVGYAYISGNKAVISHVSATAAQTGRAEFQYSIFQSPINDRTKEARTRIRSAFEQSGGRLSKTVMIESPAFAEKGPAASADLATAVSILEATGNIPPWTFDGMLLIGELKLTGKLQPVRGLCIMIREAVRAGLKAVVVPHACAAEAAYVGGIKIYAAHSLGDLVASARGTKPLDEVAPKTFVPSTKNGVDFADVRAMDPKVGRGLEIAAVGGLSALLIGHPGAGKTMLARRLTTILPTMTASEAAELTEVHSLAGLVNYEVGVIAGRPFRAPHHTVSAAGLAGGGSPLRPGEVSLAHNGVLFLDEVTEFRGSCLESLGVALRDGVSHLVRSNETANYPAKPLVIAAALPCACGFDGDAHGRCSCSPEMKQRHHKRLTTGFASRFDIRLRLGAVKLAALNDATPAESSEIVRERVTKAKAFREQRLALGPTEPKETTALYRVARTIADMAQSIQILEEHYEEARSFV